jgi:UDP-glucose 4-epimerase
MNIVIIGSESFVGRELKAHCAKRGIGVVGIDLVKGEDPATIVADIRSASVADFIPEGADAIVHLAAISRDQDCKRDPVGAFDVNVKGVLNLIAAAQTKKVKQFIFASSEWVYGNSKDGEVQRESDPIDINKVAGEYALTKLVGERMLAMAHQRGLCPVTVLRFGIIYGPRTKPMSAPEGIFNEVKTLDPLEMKGSLSSGRCFIHVSDIADGILTTLGHPGYEVFNLCGNRLVTFREIIEECKNIHGKNPKIVETDPKAVNVRNPDNTKFRKTFNWAPKIDIAQGLATLLAFQKGKG